MTHGQYLFNLLQQLDSFVDYLNYCPQDRKFHLLDIIFQIRQEIKELEVLTQSEKNRPIKFIKISIESTMNLE